MRGTRSKSLRHCLMLQQSLLSRKLENKVLQLQLQAVQLCRLSVKLLYNAGARRCCDAVHHQAAEIARHQRRRDASIRTADTASTSLVLGVSSFGAQGSNAHALVRGPPRLSEATGLVAGARLPWRRSACWVIPRAQVSFQLQHSLHDSLPRGPDGLP